MRTTCPSAWIAKFCLSVLRQITISDNPLRLIAAGVVASLLSIGSSPANADQYGINLSGPSSAGSSFTLTWSSIGANYYNLYQSKDNGAYSVVTGVISGPMSYTATGRTPGVYKFYVAASWTTPVGDYSVNSDVVTVTVVGVPPTPATLSSPASSGTGSYTVSWSSSSEATSYQLDQSANSGTWSNVLNANATSYSVSGLSNGSYAYRVRACNVAGCSAYTATSTTVVTLLPSTPALSVPASNTTGSYTVSWSVAGGATSYQLDKRVNGGGWSTVVNANTTTYAASEQSNGSYDYRVRACNVSGCSANSTIASTTVLLPPSAPTASAPASSATGTFSVSWTTPATATGFQLQQRLNGGTWGTVYSGGSTAYSASSLANGTYDYQVSACNSSGCGAYSSVATTVVLLPPAAPTVTAPSSNTSGSFTVSWGVIATAASYQLDQNIDGGTWTTILNASATSKAISGLGNGTYGYRVRACNASGCSANSATAATVVLLPPAVPSGLNSPATSVSGSYSVSWSASPTATSYQLDQRTDGGSWTTVLNANATTYNASALGSGSYDYQVRACNASGCSVSSSAVTTLVGSLPGVPAGLSSPAGSATGSYTVSWSTAVQATSYQLDQRLNGGSWSNVFDGGTTSFDTSALGDGTYDYRVRACNTFGCSAYSNAVTTAVEPLPAMPSSLSAPSTDATGTFTVAWGASSGADEYRLDQRLDSGAWSTIYTGALTSYLATALGNGTYDFRVQACNLGGCSSYSATATTVVALIPATPTGLSLPASSAEGTFTVSWDAAVSATSYDLDQRLASGLWATVYSGASVSHDVTGLIIGSYEYRVRACGAGGCSAYSTIASTAVLWTGTIPQSMTPAAIPTVNQQDINSSDTIGSTAGKFRVDESGAATYSIPIFAVPGTAGVTPQISVNYSSQGGNGVMGRGWSIGGVSAISRCRQTLQQDNNPLPITWSKNDRFCLDGQRLLLSDDSANQGKEYGDPGTVYDTEVDTYITVTAVGGTAGQGNPNYFMVTRKDGSTSYYGSAPTPSSTDAKIVNPANGRVFVWSLKKFQDSVGNPIWFVYNNTTSGQHVNQSISEVRYAYGSVQNNPDSYHARLVFNYDTDGTSVQRPDPQHRYTAGLDVATLQRLTSVSSENIGVVVRTYNFNYKSAETAGQVTVDLSRLDSIQECASGTTNCLPATTFTWSDTTSQVGFDTANSISTSLGSVGRGRTLAATQPADINGDGCQDLIWLEAWTDNGGDVHMDMRYAMSDCQGHLTPTQFSNGAWEVPFSSALMQSVDYNADGRMDIMVYAEEYGWSVYLASPQDDGSWRLSNSRIATALPVPTNVPTYTGSDLTSAADFNSDGLSDVMFSTGKDVDDSLSISSYALQIDSSAAVSSDHYYTFGSAKPWNPPSAETNFRLAPTSSGAIDFNGDGIVDAMQSDQVHLVDIPNTTTLTYYYGAEFYTVAPGSSSNQLNRYGSFCQDCGPSIKNVQVVDLNGDGLPDIVYQALEATGNPLDNPSTDPTSYFAINTGTGFAAGQSIGTDVPLQSPLGGNGAKFIDYNQDGYTDIVWNDIPAGQIKVRLWDQKTGQFGATLANPILTTTAGNTTDEHLFLDMNGDGSPDYVTISGDTVVIAQNEGANQARQVITRITNGLLAKTDITYESLMTSGHYDRLKLQVETGTTTCTPQYDVPNVGTVYGISFPCSYSKADKDSFYTALNGPWQDLPEGTETLGKNPDAPVLEWSAPIYVVTRVESSAPATENAGTLGQVDAVHMSAVDYYYAEAKIQASGRGLLGFHRVVTLDEQTQVKTVTTYRQDFPFTGYPQSTKVFMTDESGNTLWVRTAENTWGFQNYDAANPTTGVHTQPPYRPVLLSSVENSYDALATGNPLLATITTTNTYDSYGNVLSVMVDTRDGGGNVVADKLTSNTYGSTVAEQRLGRLNNTVVTSSRPGVPPLTRTSAFTYYCMGGSPCPAGLSGLLYQEIIEPTQTDYTLTTTYDYDSFGNKIQATVSGDGETSRTTQWSYDSRDYDVDNATNTGSAPLQLGRFLDGTTDALGHLTKQVVRRNEFGEPTQVDALNGAELSYRYGPLGRRYLEYANTGTYSVTLRYSGLSGCPSGTAFAETTESGGGTTSSACYDVLARPIRTMATSFTGAAIYADKEYDDLGRVVHVTEPYSAGTPSANVYFTKQAYDTLGRPTVTTYPDGTFSKVDYETPSAMSTQFTDANSHTKVETKNVLGELTQVVDAKGGTLTYTYDAQGNVLNTVATAGTSGVASGVPATITTTLTYDLLGRKKTMVDPDQGSWSYDYNRFGELIKQTDAKGQVTKMAYDVLGRMAERLDCDTDSNCTSAPQGSAVRGHTVWHYDTADHGVGQLDYVEDTVSGYVKLLAYDQYGRTVQTGVSPAGAEIYEQRVIYDRYGRVYQQYDSAGPASGVQNVYNDYGYLSQVLDVASNQEYYAVESMDARGNVTEARMGNGYTITHTYDDVRGRLTAIGSSLLGLYNNTLQNLSYQYDDVGNLTQRKDDNKSLIENFTYDELNRLHTDQVVGQTTITTNYDSFANVSSKDGVGTYSYADSGAGPHAVTGISGAGAAVYGYDANGNNISGDGRTITYSTFNKPLTISKGTTSSSFAYDPDRQFYKRVDDNNGQVTKTLYMGSVERVTKPDGSIEVRRYLPGNALITANYDSSGNLQGVPSNQYLLKDPLGSVDVIVDQTGNVTQGMSFDPWGLRRAVADWTALSSSALAAFDHGRTNHGFTGHEMLDEVGVIHMNGRIYDPKLGRFLQADPTVQFPDDLQSYSRYSYVLNNPLIYTDPSGYSLVDGFLSTVNAGFTIGMDVALYHACGAWGPACVAAFTAGKAIGDGASWNQALKVGAISGASAFAFQQIGDYFEGQIAFNAEVAEGLQNSLAQSGIQVSIQADLSTLTAERIAAHALTGGVMATLSGDNFGNGFVAAGLTVGLSGPIGQITNNSYVHIAVAAVVGGTVSAMTGGKFSNGATYAAFSRAFNDEGDHRTVSSYLPGSSAGDRAAEYWANRLVASGGGFTDDPIAASGLFFSSLWTTDTAASTAFTLVTAGISSVSYFARLSYFRYIGPYSNPASRWLIVSASKEAPYASMNAAKEALQLPNMPATYEAVNVPWWKPVVGPRAVWRNPEWGAGGGKEWYQGWWFPD